MTITLAIIGRPNVGKSTFFNRLVGKKRAITHDLPGVTRDRKYGVGKISDLEFNVVDTAGFEFEKKINYKKEMLKQTNKALTEGDVVLFMLDGKDGLTEEDKEVARKIRKNNKPVILVINKCENASKMYGLEEFEMLGFKEIVYISAEHGSGMSDFYDILIPHFKKYDEDHLEQPNVQESTEETGKQRPVEVAIIGRPNAGKSTLVNSFLEDERVICGPESGLTRDSISIDWEFNGRKIKLTDTAGLRKKKNVDNKIEFLSNYDAIKSMKFAKIVIIMTTPESFGEKQDLSIIDLVIKEGRLPIIAVNKWDTATNKEELADEITYKVEKSLTDIQNVPVIFISALKKQNLGELMEHAIKNLEIWEKKLSTSVLNQWLEHALNTHQPPLVSVSNSPQKKRVKFKYITQTHVKPPSFIIFCNIPKFVPKTYVKYLVNSMRDAFELDGVPIRFKLKASENPYGKKKK